MAKQTIITPRIEVEIHLYDYHRPNADPISVFVGYSELDSSKSTLCVRIPGYGAGGEVLNIQRGAGEIAVNVTASPRAVPFGHVIRKARKRKAR